MPKPFPSDIMIRAALPELDTLLEGIMAVARLPDTDPAYDHMLDPLVDMCREFARLRHNDTPLFIFLLSLSTAARISRAMINRGVQ